MAPTKTKTTKTKAKTPKATAKAAASEAAPAKVKKAKKPRDIRFLGWQLTPTTQAAYGRSTKGGSQNTRFKVLNSTGSVKETNPRWYLIDASKAPIGRLATTISSILIGKTRTTYTPGAGSGDGVIVINADKAYFTANKEDKKVYYWHSHWMGGLKNITAGHQLKQNPEKVLWMAVQGMLPKNKISRYQLALLKIYKGAEHPHSAQNPIPVGFETPLKKIS